MARLAFTIYAMLLSLALLSIAFLVILLAAELFTNGIEWLGHKLSLSEGAVGSVLAAVGTAMPETLIPFVAIIFFGAKHGHEVGVGAIVGAPFMLSTLTLALFGLSCFIFAKSRAQEEQIAVAHEVIRRDLIFFLCAFASALIFGLVPLPKPAHYAFSIFLLFVYFIYLQKTFSHEGECGQAPERLHFDWLLRQKRRRLWLVVCQVLVGLSGIVGGAFLFVHQVQELASMVGLSPTVLSLVISPIATELPEKINSILWARRGKDTLAMANITGALVFQACFPVAFGVSFSKWQLGAHTLLPYAIALLACLFWLFLIGGKKLKWHHLAVGLPAYVLVIGWLLVFAGP